MNNFEYLQKMRKAKLLASLPVYFKSYLKGAVQ